MSHDPDNITTAYRHVQTKGI